MGGNNGGQKTLCVYLTNSASNTLTVMLVCTLQDSVMSGYITQGLVARAKLNQSKAWVAIVGLDSDHCPTPPDHSLGQNVRNAMYQCIQEQPGIS